MEVKIQKDLQTLQNSLPTSITSTQSRSRPLVTTILAMSADGKISDAQRTAARFPSAADKRHLETCLATVDATLFGAATLRAYGTTALIKDPALLEIRHRRHQPPQPIHIVCSPSGQLDPAISFFQQPVQRWLLTTEPGGQPWQNQPQFDRVWTVPRPGGQFHWPRLFSELKTLGIEHLLVMGGGQLVADLMGHDLIDELRLTVCPLIIGGQQAPTPCDGAGFAVANAPRFSLIEHHIIDDEVFLHYRRQRATLP